MTRGVASKEQFKPKYILKRSRSAPYVTKLLKKAISKMVAVKSMISRGLNANNVLKVIVLSVSSGFTVNTMVSPCAPFVAILADAK